MAWEWSHSAEAYQNARENVQKLSRETLAVIYAEWFGLDNKDHPEGAGLNPGRYAEGLVKAERLPNDVLADFIWERMEEQRTCDNGGFNAHCCPFGCLCHVVSFDRDEKEQDS